MTLEESNTAGRQALITCITFLVKDQRTLFDIRGFLFLHPFLGEAGLSPRSLRPLEIPCDVGGLNPYVASGGFIAVYNILELE